MCICEKVIAHIKAIRKPLDNEWIRYEEQEFTKRRIFVSVYHKKDKKWTCHLGYYTRFDNDLQINIVEPEMRYCPFCGKELSNV